jgi:hypothetical protein
MACVKTMTTEILNFCPRQGRGFESSRSLRKIATDGIQHFRPVVATCRSLRQIDFTSEGGHFSGRRNEVERLENIRAHG